MARPRQHHRAAEHHRIGRLLSDAYQCATLASSYIDKAAMSLLDSGTEAPFQPQVPGLEGAHPPARPAISNPTKPIRERGEWRDQRYHQGGRARLAAMSTGRRARGYHLQPS